MEIQNNLENKARFFAHYWGQAVMVYNGKYITPSDFIRTPAISDCYLELAPLSQISDEDKEYLDALQASSFDEYGYWFGMGGVHYYQPHEVDYLRSRGYALPFMGISVETLVEWGWVKLKGGEND